jgi:uncharacterized protein YjeT (DUF2065 family)
MNKTLWLIVSLLLLVVLRSLLPDGLLPQHWKRSAATPVKNDLRLVIPTPRPFAEPGQIALIPAAPAPLAQPEDRSPIADQLNTPNRTIGQDLSIVFDLLEYYRGMYGSLPTAEENAHVVNALTGNNPRRLAFIERSHPAINPKGELTDRWGTAFFFHFLSRDAVEIRSAGADLTLYTPDDTLKRSPSLQTAPAAATD